MDKEPYLTTFLKADDNTLINPKKILWIQKYKECIYVCTKSTGCSTLTAHSICKHKTFDSYEALKQYFE